MMCLAMKSQKVQKYLAVMTILATIPASGTVLKFMAQRSLAAVSVQTDPHCRSGIVSLKKFPDDNGSPSCCAGYCGACNDYDTCKNVRGQASQHACCASKVYERRCGNAPANVCLQTCSESTPPCIMDIDVDSMDTPKPRPQVSIADAGSPCNQKQSPGHYMSHCGNAVEIARDAHDVGIARGHLFASVYIELQVKYQEAMHIADLVAVKAWQKMKDAEKDQEALEKKIASATAADNVKDPTTNSSLKTKWMDQIENEQGEQNFFSDIVNNSHVVLHHAREGMVEAIRFKKLAEAAIDITCLEKLQAPFETRAEHASTNLDEAKKLWQQWLDSSKAYNCGPPPAVEHAQSVCKDADTKFSPKCQITCMQGYDDPDDSKNTLRCQKRGNFGQQLYGEWRGMAVCVGRMCGKPGSIENAKTVIQDIRFPHAATYNCFEGDSQDTKPKGQKSFDVHCGKEGQFEQNSSHACQRIECGSATSWPGTEPISGTYFFSDVADHKCTAGHTLDETPGGLTNFSTSCQATGKFSQGHACKPVRCGPANEYDAATLVSEKGEKYYNDEVTYKCNLGHSVDQSPSGPTEFSLMCHANGEFVLKGSSEDVPVPLCQPVSAGMLPAVEHGKTKRREMFYGDTALYTADTGYSSGGNSTEGLSFIVSVTPTGTFAGLTKFVPVSCGAAPSVKKAQTSFSAKEGVYGNILNYDCEEGYSTDKSDSKSAKTFTVQCEADADYSRVPDLGYCANIDDCAEHTCGPHGSCVDGLMNYTCSCDSGYNQTWNKDANEFVCGNINDCGPKACGVGTCKDLVNGYKCICPVGYSEVGELDGKSCKANVCGTPPRVAHAATLPIEAATAKTSYGDEVLFQCNAGYTLNGVAGGKNHFTIDCQADGKLTRLASQDQANLTFLTASQAQTCKPIQCGEGPAVANASASPSAVTFNETIRYTCAEGYTIDGTTTGDKSFAVTCAKTGKYGAAQKCQPINCGVPDDVPNSARPDGSLVYGESVAYACYDGFTLNSKATTEAVNSTAQCSKWNTDPTMYNCETVPKCCTGFEAKGISTDTVQCVEKSLGDDYAVMCPKARPADGETQFSVKCNADGSLDKSKSCLPKVCGLPGKFINALSSTTANEGPVAYPRVTEVTCRDGYTVGGSAGDNTSFTVACLSTGKFEKYDKNACKPVRCGKAPAMKNATLDHVASSGNRSAGENLNFEEKAFYKCLDGFSTGGEPSSPTMFKVECLANGEFSSPAADMQCRNINDCEQHTCGPKGKCIDLIGPAPAYTCECEFGFSIQTKANGEKHCGNTDNCKDQDCGVGVCKDLIGDYTCTCPSGHHIGEVDGKKTCVPVRCADAAPSLGNGTMQTTHSGPVDYSTTLRYTCDKGYSTDGQTAASKREFQVQCKPCGQLAGMMSCQRITCGSPKVLSNAKLVAPWTPVKSVEYEEEVMYECLDGYTVSGHGEFMTDFTVTCQDDGVLTDPEVCEPVECGLAPAVNHTQPSVSGVVTYGMLLEYKCDTGYSLDSTYGGKAKFERHCLNTGTFSDLLSPQPCKAISGGKAPTLENAHMTEYAGLPVTPEGFPPTVYYPNGLEYRCSPGFSEDGTLSGPVKLSTRVNSHGKLAPALPSGCIPIEFNVNGEVKDARDGKSLGAATVRIVGATGASQQTTSGLFALTGIRPGNVTVEYKKDGYIDTTKTFDVDGDIVVGGAADISMSPKMESDAWRAVVKWGEQPTDLDTYGSWGSSQVSWTQRSASARGIQVTLEHDDTDSYGPETLHFSGVGHCTGGAQYCDIKYAINDYTRTGRMKDISKAEVTLYTGDRVAGTWTIKGCPDSVSSDGNWWHVFTLDAKTNKLKWNCHMQPETTTTTTTTTTTATTSELEPENPEMQPENPEMQPENPEDGTLNLYHGHAVVNKNTSASNAHTTANKSSLAPSVHSDLKPPVIRLPQVREEVFTFKPPVLSEARAGFLRASAK